MGPRSRSMRPPGGGVSGGVMVAMDGMCIILMLSSASAPSRVPQVVWWPVISTVACAKEGGGLKTYLRDSYAAV